VLINNVAAVLFRQKLKRPGIATNTTYLNHLDIIKLAIPLLANTLLVIAIGRIGLWTAGYNFEKDSVAIYGAALQLALLLTQPLLIINTLTMPLIADMFHNDTDHGRLEKVLRTTTSLVAWPFILFFLGLVIFGSDLLTIIFDKSYAQGYWVLVFLAAGQLSTLVVGPSGLILKMTNHHNFLVTINCVTGLITLVLSILAAQKYSIEGVAAVAMSTIIIKNIFVLHFTARKTRIFSAIFLRPSEIVDVFNHGMRTMRGKKRTNII
jgi:O-antigen/teichoic acid export membrane protein